MADARPKGKEIALHFAAEDPDVRGIENLPGDFEIVGSALFLWLPLPSPRVNIVAAGIYRLIGIAQSCTRNLARPASSQTFVEPAHGQRSRQSQK